MLNKFTIGTLLLFMMAGALMLAMAPDALSMLFVVLMCLIVVLGVVFGMAPCMSFYQEFRQARKTLRRIGSITSNDHWMVLQQSESMFRFAPMVRMFKDYMEKANEQYKKKEVVSDIETVISEDAMALHCWQGACLQIPGTLTGLGLLGTFVGLIVGISNIGFSSVDAALSSVEVLLSGIEVAFFTSVAGVILSILYNLINKLMWNISVRELELFTRDFHVYVMPTAEEQVRQFNSNSVKAILERLDRLPKNGVFASSGSGNSQDSTDQSVLLKVQDAIRDGEFCFYLQPCCNLMTREIVGAEALIRWNHSELGLLEPGSFMSIIEKNGYIARLDQYIWEMIFKTIRQWIDGGVRPLPVSVNISGMDVLAFDVPAFFKEMLEKYRIPPCYFEIEITQASYVSNGRIILEAEEALRAQGFKVIMDSFDGDFLAISSVGANPDAYKVDVNRQKGGLMQIFAQARAQHVQLRANRIESMEQLMELRRAGCAEGQGYALYEPMSVEDFLEVTKRSKKNAKHKGEKDKKKKERKDEEEN